MTKIDRPVPKKCLVRDRKYYRVDLRYLNLGQKFFAQTTQGYKDARDHCEEVWKAQRKYGEAIAMLSIKQHADALVAFEILNGSTITMTELARQWKATNRGELNEKTLKDARDQYLRWMINTKERNFRPNTRKSASSKTERMCEGIGGDKLVHLITPDEITKFFDDSGYTENTRRGYWMSLKIFFNYCIRKKFCYKNPLDEIPKPEKAYRDIIILKPPSMLHTLLSTSVDHYPDMICPIAIKFFTGIRSSELEGLKLGDIDLESGYIHITTENSKTKRERLVPIENNLRQILEKHLTSRPKWSDHKWKIICELAEFEPTSNVARKSYVSYYSRWTGDLNRTVQNAGNSVQMAVGHYQKMVTDKQANEYWGIIV